MPATTAAGFHDLETMIQYMDSNCEKIQALAGEIAEIQREFETHFVQAQQRYENAKAAAMAWVEAHDWQQPAWLIQAIEQRLPAVREQEQKRLAELQKQLGDLQTQQAGIEQENDEVMQRLRTQNPALDAREEELKQQELGARDRFYRLNDDWHKSAGGLRWLLSPGGVRKAREAMEQANVQWVDINARLAEVRNAWVALKQKMDETGETLQAAWRLRTAEIARLKRELSAVRGDLDAGGREAALADILGAVAEAKQSDQAEFDKLLAEVIAAHDEANQYESGIAQVAELIGLIAGVCEGLTRMSESVKSVKAEQDMHAELADLKLPAPEAALRFHALWDELRPLVLDEKKAAKHPGPFAAAVRQAIGDHLSNAAIDEMFTSLGDELNRATKEQWG